MNNKSSALWSRLLDPTHEVSTFYRNLVVGFLGGGLFLLPLVILPGMRSSLTSYFFTFVWFVTLLVFGLGLTGIVKNVQIPRTAFWYLLSVLVISRFASTLTSIIPFRSWWGAYGIWSDGLLFLLLMVILVAVIWALRLSRREIIGLIYIFFFQSLVLSLLTLFEVETFGVTRPISTLANSDYFISYGLLLFPLSVTFAWYYWTHPNSDDVTLKALRWGHLLHVVILGLAIFVCLPPVLQQQFVRWEKKPQVGQVIDNASNAERWLQWRWGLEVGKAYPLLGSGPGTTRSAVDSIQRTVTIPDWNYRVAIDHPHNEVIEYFAQGGYSGLAAYIIFWCGLAIYIAKHRKKILQDNRFIVLGLSLGLMAYFLFNMLLFSTVWPAIVGWVWVGLILILTDSLNYTPVSLRWRRIHRSLYVAVLIGLLVLSGVTFKYYRGFLFTTRGIESLAQGMIPQASEKMAQALTSFPQEDAFHYNQALVFLLGQQSLAGNETVRKSVADVITSNMLTVVTHDPYSIDKGSGAGAVIYLANAHGSPEEKNGEMLMQKMVELSPKSFIPVMRMAYAYLLKGDKQKLDSVIKELEYRMPGFERDKFLSQGTSYIKFTTELLGQ